MPLQSWDVVVHGRSYHLELDRNADTGRHLLRLDGRMAVKPFDATAEVRFEVAGKPYLLHSGEGTWILEDKGSRYHDASAPRTPSNLGRITVERGLERTTVITDEGLLRIDKLSDAMKMAGSSAAGGGLLGAIVADVALNVAQKISNKLGEQTIRRPFRSFAELEAEGTGKVEHLPYELITLFENEADLDANVLVIPRHCVRATNIEGTKLHVETEATRRSAAKPHRLDMGAQGKEIVDHLCASGYPLSQADMARTSEDSRLERARRERERAAMLVPAQAPPPPPAAPALQVQPQRNPGGTPEVRWTAPLATVIGRDELLLEQMKTDMQAFASVYPKTVMRRLPLDDPFRNLGRERYDIVQLAGVFDDKTRFRETGFSMSLRDVITRLVEGRVRMLWLGSANEEGPAESTLQWVNGLNVFVVFTLVRGPDYPVVMAEALRRLAGGTLLSTVLPELERSSESRWRVAGRGEALFLAQ